MSKYLYNKMLHIPDPASYPQEEMQHFFNPFIMKGLPPYMLSICIFST